MNKSRKLNNKKQSDGKQMSLSSTASSAASSGPWEPWRSSVWNIFEERIF